MSEYSPHNGDTNSNVSSISDTGNLQAASTDTIEEIANINGKPTAIRKKVTKAGFNPQLVLAAKRQSYLKKNGDDHRFLDSTSYLAMVQAMGNDKLYKPFLSQQLTDLREGNKPDGHYSATLIWAVIAGAKALPYASDMAMDLWAANSDEEPTPVEPHLEIDKAA